MSHPDDDADRRAEESERRQEVRDLYCSRCGNKRISINGRWRCYGCDGAPKDVLPIGAVGEDAAWKEKLLKLENALTGDWGDKK